MIKIMLDSGAFSAWTRDKVIDLDEYIAFIKRFEDDLETYVNLDVIPGKPGTLPSEKEVDFSANAGWENYQKMLGEGLNSIPVFHFGENIKWLKKMIDSGVDYIGLGGVVGRPRTLVRKWLDKVFSMITDEEGYPIVKTHGFGISATPLIVRYPWYSVDSSTWWIWSGLGKVCVPRYDEQMQSYNYSKSPFMVPISDKNPKIMVEGQHYSNFNKYVKDAVSDYCTVKGYDQEELRMSRVVRLGLNSVFYNDLVSNISVGKYVGNTGGFFKSPKFKKSDKITPWENTLFYFSSGGLKDVIKLSHSVKNPNILLSYEYTPKIVEDNYFKRYINAAKVKEC